MEQNGLDLGSVLEIFLPVHPSSQNTHAHLCAFVGGEKLAKKVFKAMSAFSVLLLLYKAQNNIMRLSESLKYASMGYCYLTSLVYFPVLTQEGSVCRAKFKSPSS